MDGGSGGVGPVITPPPQMQHRSEGEVSIHRHFPHDPGLSSKKLQLWEGRGA